MTSAQVKRLPARTLVPGQAAGLVQVLDAPLSFWGGVDSATGRIIDRRHPQLGADLAGQVLVMVAGRGSGSSSSVLAEAIRRGTAPAAIVLREPDLILAVGATIAAELYGRSCPVVVLDPTDYARLRPGQCLTVNGSATGAHVDIAPEEA